MEVLCPAKGLIEVVNSRGQSFAESPYKYIIVDVQGARAGTCMLETACAGCTQALRYVVDPFPAVVAVGAYDPEPDAFNTDLNRARELALMLQKVRELNEKMRKR